MFHVHRFQCESLFLSFLDVVTPLGCLPEDERVEFLCTFIHWSVFLEVGFGSLDVSEWDVGTWIGHIFCAAVKFEKSTKSALFLDYGFFNDFFLIFNKWIRALEKKPHQTQHIIAIEVFYFGLKHFQTTDSSYFKLFIWSHRCIFKTCRFVLCHKNKNSLFYVRNMFAAIGEMTQIGLCKSSSRN